MDEGRLEHAETRARELWKRNPDNPGVQKIVRDLGERLRRTLATREQPLQSLPDARKEAYLERRREVLELMKSQKVDEAVMRLQELATAFPDDPQVGNDLRRLTALRDQAGRKAPPGGASESPQGLVRSREFAQPIYGTKELQAIFSPEPEPLDLLDHARRDRAARKETYARRRKDFEELVRNRDFDGAVSAAERLALEFPEEPDSLEDLRRARAARDQAQRKTAAT
jgi:hypothetical protein